MTSSAACLCPHHLALRTRQFASLSLSCLNFPPFPYFSPSFPFVPIVLQHLCPLLAAGIQRQEGQVPSQGRRQLLTNEFPGGSDNDERAGWCRAGGHQGGRRAWPCLSATCSVTVGIVILPGKEDKEVESGKTSELIKVLMIHALKPFPRGPHKECPGVGGGEEGPWWTGRRGTEAQDGAAGRD